MYVELVERDIKNRNKIIEFGVVPQNPVNYCRYISLFPYDAGIINHVETNKSVSGYSGLHYCPAIIIDIDNEDLETSRLDAVSLIKRLNEYYLLSTDDIRIFFSGNKGFHIGLHQKIFGQLPAHKEIAQFVKKFVAELSQGIASVDLKIYEPMRIFRCTNSINDKSGLYKIPINFGELSGSIESIRELAKTPRTDFKYNKPSTDIQKNEKLYSLLSSIRIDEKTKNTIPDGFFTPAVVGDRNNKLFKQACMLIDKSEINIGGIIEILKSINNAGENPLQEFEIVNIVRSAQQKTNRKEKQPDELIIKSFGEWADEWYDSILPEKNKITLGLPAFDKEMKGKVRGKLVCIVGAGGTKKSLMAQNLVYDNVLCSGMRAIYSTMEMGVTTLEERFIDMAVDGRDYNFSFELELENNKRPGIAKEILIKDIAPSFSDKLLITQNTGLTCKEYSTLIDRVKSEIGVVDILIVDGLSMMGGNGTETELVNTHTKELKALAVKYNILVIAIVHVTKEADQTTRDYTKYLRGSGKIYDNLDVIINMSLFRDTYNDEFIKDRGFAKLINKRGTGNHVNIVYAFDGKRLTITETGETLDNFAK